MSVIKRFLEMYQQGTYHPPKKKKKEVCYEVTNLNKSKEQESQPVKNEKKEIKQLNFNF